MPASQQPSSLASQQPRVRVAVDGHRVTPFELFFDLVFVFAITQVTGYIAHTHTGLSIVQGGIVFGLLWWAWSSYAWLGNQAHADYGLIRLGMVPAMIAVFVVALSIPEAWHDAPGGLDAPMVLAVAYIVIRLVHEGLYVLAAADDRGLRHQLALNLLPLIAGGTLLLVGAAVNDTARTWIWTAALAVDWLLTYVTSMRGRGWRIHSIAHWVARHGLVVILALGESSVAIGKSASEAPIDWELLVGASLGILVATALWWLYFDISADAAERALHRREPAEQVQAAIEAYTYLHYWMILGIVITAAGIEQALAHANGSDSLGGFAAGCLCLGPAAYLAGHVASWIRLDQVVKRQRVVATAGLIVL
ncbi:MAG: low temperature requirement protein A [Actinobacteria bacterium]|nr:MAG: low temperature requirement protein A [Actinomycetota bacterium]